MENSIWIAIHNIFTVDGKEKLTGDELYTYYGLCLNELRWFKCKIEMSIETISKNIQLRKNENENKTKIEKILRSMREKNVIMFDDVETNEKGNYKYSVPINIYKYDDEHYKTHVEKHKKGFEKIYLPIFDRMQNVDPVDRGRYFLVCCYIAKVKREISFFEWSSVLGCSEKQARIIIDKMNDKDIIVKNSGRYYFNDKNQIRQEINTYVVPDEVISNADIGTIPEYIEVEISMGKGKVSRNEKFAIEEIKTEIFDPTWTSKLYYQHYYYAHKYQNDDPKTYEKYQKRLRKLGDKYDTSHYVSQFEADMKFEQKKKIEREIESFLKENGHVVVCDDRYYTVDQIEDWQDVDDVIHDYGSGMKLSLQNNNLFQFVLEELEERKTLNEEVWEEIVNKWKSERMPKVKKEEERYPQYKKNVDKDDISDLLKDDKEDDPLWMTIFDDE